MPKLFSLVTLLFFLSPAFAALNESTRPSQIHVYLDQNAPFSTVVKDKNAHGLLVDYWQEWSRLTGIEVKYYPYQNQDLEFLSNDQQPAVYSGLRADPESLLNLKKQPLLIVNSHFFYLGKQHDKVASALLEKKSKISVGGLFAQAQQLPLFASSENIAYTEYPGFLELLFDIYNDQIDAFVLFEGVQDNRHFFKQFLSVFFSEKLINDTDNELFVYTPENQKIVLDWINWGNQLENFPSTIGVAIDNAANPLWGASSGMQIKLLLIALGIFLLFVFSRFKRKKDLQFKTLLDDSPYPLVILSLDGSVIYYLNDELNSLFPTTKVNHQYIFDELENKVLLSEFINKASHKVMIEAESIRLIVNNSFHDIEISAKRVYYKGKSAWLCYLKDVNALLRAEQKLIEERELLRNVLDSIPEQIFFKSPKGTVIGCNESWAEANNTTVKKATGKRLSNIVPIETVNKQKQQEAEVWIGTKFKKQEWHQQLNDELSLINTIKLPLYNEKGGVFALLSIENDVTDFYNLNKKLVDENLQRKKTENALSKQNTLLNTVFAASTDPIGLLDKDNRVTGGNNAFAKLMGFSKSEDIVGRLQNEILSEDRNEWAERQNQEVFDTGKAHKFDELIFIDGNKFWYEVCKTPFMDSDNNYQGIVVMARDITLHKQTEEKLSSEASDFETKMLHDPLTGVANRRAFDLQFNKLWQEACDEQELLSVVMCDIDFFKLYNDNYGHQKGDQALQGVAHALQSACEKFDCFVARYGGEEFVVLIKGGNATNALKIAEALRESVAQAKIEHLYSSVSTIITLSMGLSSILPSDLNTMSILLAEADGALYESKKYGRDQVSVH